MKKYFRVWKKLAELSAISYMSSRVEYGTYFIGKVIRISFFFLLITSIFDRTQNIVGYSKYQVIVFFLTAFFIDSLGQALYRGIYYFRQDIQTANFDYVISKPLNPLFHILFRKTDLLDMVFLLCLVPPIIYSFSKLGVLGNPLAMSLYLLFLLVAMFLVTSLHVISVALTVWTMESETYVWIYRNAMFASLFPPDIFSNPVQLFFTFIIPIVVTVAVPSKALLGILTIQMALTAFAVTFVFFFGSLLLWKVALKHYSSASS